MAELTALAVKKAAAAARTESQSAGGLGGLNRANAGETRPETAEFSGRGPRRTRTHSGRRLGPAAEGRFVSNQRDPARDPKKKDGADNGDFQRRTKEVALGIWVGRLFGLIAIVGAVAAIIVASSKTPETASSDKKAADTPIPAVAKEVVYLADLPIVDQQHWPSDMPGKGEPKDRGPKDKGPKDKGPKGKGPKGKGPGVGVSINGKISPHGIFMHPPPPPFEGEPVSISFNVGKRFQTFKGTVSINDGPESSETPCTFRVFGDDKSLWQSTPVSSQADSQVCTLRIDGVEVLRIEVVCPGPPRGAHAVWIEPQVVK